MDAVEIQHMSRTAAPCTDLHDAAAPNDHGNHRRGALRAAGSPGEFRVAVRAEKVDDGIHRHLVFGLYRVAAVEAGEAQPAVRAPERNRHTDGGIAFDQVLFVHQAVVAARTTHLDREDALVALDFDFVQSSLGRLDDVPYLRGIDV